MQIFAFSVALLAAFGAEAVPWRPVHFASTISTSTTSSSLPTPTPGKNETIGTYAIGQCTAYNGQCLVNGRRQLCQVGSCSNINTACDNDAGIVSCT